MHTFLSVEEFRHSFGPKPLPRDLTYRLLREKRIKSMRLGNKYLIAADEVDNLVIRELSTVAS